MANVRTINEPLTSTIPKDIRKYDDKFIGPFSKRQVVCIVIAFACLYIINELCFYIPKDIRSEFSELLLFIKVALVTPIILCGFKSMYGLPFEVWFFSVFLRGLNKNNRKRTYKAQSKWKAYKILVDEEGDFYSDEVLEKQRKKQEKITKKVTKEAKKKTCPKIKGKKYDCYY